MTNTNAKNNNTKQKHKKIINIYYNDQIWKRKEKKRHIYIRIHTTNKNFIQSILIPLPSLFLIYILFLALVSMVVLWLKINNYLSLDY